MQGRRTRQIARISREGDGDGDTNTVAHVTTPHPPCINSHVNIDFSMEVVHLYVFEPLVRALLKAFIPKLRSEDAVQNEMEYATAQPLRKNQPTVCAIRFLSRFASLLALFTGIFRRNTLRINRRTPPTTIRPSSSFSRSSVSLSLFCSPVCASTPPPIQLSGKISPRDRCGGETRASPLGHDNDDDDGGAGANVVSTTYMLMMVFVFSCSSVCVFPVRALSLSLSL